MRLLISLWVAFFLSVPVMAEKAGVERLVRIPVQAVFLSDDDGQRRVNCTSEQVKRWVDFADKAFASAQIFFVFEPDSDYCSAVRSTLLNSMMGTNDRNWHEARKLANKIAASYPGRLVAFFRYGAGPEPTGGGFSWWDYNFVAMPGYENASHCGHPHTDAFAHETGHFLGLPHTFASDPFQTVPQAEAYFKEKGNDIGCFDGDGISDTPPDPSIRPLECERTASVVLDGTEFSLPRRNLMSYYDERDSLSPQQIRRARWVLETRMKHDMAMPTNDNAGSTLEAEKLSVKEKTGCNEVVQQMSYWGAHQWSGGAQVFCNAQPNGRITLTLPASEPGKKRISIYTTRSYDYGIIRVSIDGKQIGEAIDTYSPIVIPSGKIELGTTDLTSGQHELRFDVVGKNEESTGFCFGIDCVLLK